VLTSNTVEWQNGTRQLTQWKDGSGGNIVGDTGTLRRLQQDYNGPLGSSIRRPHRQSAPAWYVANLALARTATFNIRHGTAAQRQTEFICGYLQQQTLACTASDVDDARAHGIHNEPDNSTKGSARLDNFKTRQEHRRHG